MLSYCMADWGTFMVVLEKGIVMLLLRWRGLGKGIVGGEETFLLLLLLLWGEVDKRKCLWCCFFLSPLASTTQATKINV